MPTTQSTQGLKSGLNTTHRKEVSQGTRGSLPLTVQSVPNLAAALPLFFPFILLLSLFLFFSFFPFIFSPSFPFRHALPLRTDHIFPFDRILFPFLFFFFSFSILVTHGNHVSPSHPFMWHKGAMHLAMWHLPPTWHLIYGYDAMWHPATCHLAIYPFHLEVHEILIVSEFDKICLGN